MDLRVSRISVYYVAAGTSSALSIAAKRVVALHTNDRVILREELLKYRAPNPLPAAGHNDGLTD